MALNVTKLESDLLDLYTKLKNYTLLASSGFLPGVLSYLYTKLNKYDNTPGKKPEDARRVLSEELSAAINSFIKSGRVKITIGDNTYYGTIE